MGTASTTGTSLTAADRRAIAMAREMAALKFDELRSFTGYEDRAEAYIAAFVRAQLRISELLDLINERLEG